MIGWVFHSCDWRVSFLDVTELFPRQSDVVRLIFLFSPWASTLQEFLYTPMSLLVRETSYVNCHFDLASVPVRVTFNKLNLISKRLWACSETAEVWARSSRCLGRAPLLLHWLPSLVAVNFAVFTINGVFRSY